MNTPNLDKLMAQASEKHGNDLDAILCRNDLYDLFSTHGPALVAVLKYYADTAIGARAVDALLKLDQEAT